MGLALRAIDIGRADRGQMIGIAAIMRDTTARPLFRSLSFAPDSALGGEWIRTFSSAMRFDLRQRSRGDQA
jgi:hypothetical protein